MSDHIETSGKAKKTWWKRWWAIALGILVVLMVIGALAPSDEKQNAASGLDGSTADHGHRRRPGRDDRGRGRRDDGVAAGTRGHHRGRTPAEPAPVEKPSFEGDGQFVVREDIEPGTYRTREEATAATGRASRASAAASTRSPRTRNLRPDRRDDQPARQGLRGVGLRHVHEGPVPHHGVEDPVRRRHLHRRHRYRAGQVSLERRGRLLSGAAARLRRRRSTTSSRMRIRVGGRS